MSLLERLRRWRPRDRFVRNTGWMGVGEVGIRVSRLLATVVLARLLSPEDYGLAAIVLMTTEFVRVFTRNGIGDKLVQADAEEIAELCQTAWCLNWMIGTGPLPGSAGRILRRGPFLRERSPHPADHRGGPDLSHLPPGDGADSAGAPRQPSQGLQSDESGPGGGGQHPHRPAGPAGLRDVGHRSAQAARGAGLGGNDAAP